MGQLLLDAHSDHDPSKMATGSLSGNAIAFANATMQAVMPEPHVATHGLLWEEGGGGGVVGGFLFVIISDSMWPHLPCLRQQC